MSIVESPSDRSESYPSSQASDSDQQTRRMEREAQKTVDAVSRLVSQKLESYMNQERRAERFDPSGIGYYRTTVAMHKYDYLYRVLDATKLDQQSKKSKKHKNTEQENEESSNKVIQPQLNPYSRRVVLNREADRLTDYANKVFEETPVAKLHMIHRYRPSTVKSMNVVKNGKVQNYSRNVGAALKSENYVQFYLKEGLGTGNTKKSPRLQKLQEQKKNHKEKQKHTEQNAESMKSEGSVLEVSHNETSHKDEPENLRLLHTLTSKEYDDDEEEDHNGTNQTSGIVMDDDDDLVDYVYEDNDFTSEDEDEEVMQMTGSYEDDDDKSSVAEDRQSARLGEYGEVCDDEKPKRSSTPVRDERSAPPSPPPPRAESRLNGSHSSSKSRGGTARSCHSSSSSARSRAKSAASNQSRTIREEHPSDSGFHPSDERNSLKYSAHGQDRPISGESVLSRAKDNIQNSESKDDKANRASSARSTKSQSSVSKDKGNGRAVTPKTESSRPPSSAASSRSHHSRTSSKEGSHLVTASKERPGSTASSHRSSIKQGQQRAEGCIEDEDVGVNEKPKEESHPASVASKHDEINNNKVSPQHSRKSSASSSRSKEKASVQLRSKLSSAGSVRSIQSQNSPYHSRGNSAASKKGSVASRGSSAASQPSGVQSKKSSRPPSSVHSDNQDRLASRITSPRSTKEAKEIEKDNLSLRSHRSADDGKAGNSHKDLETKKDDDCYDDDFEDGEEDRSQKEKEGDKADNRNDYEDDFEDDGGKETGDTVKKSSGAVEKSQADLQSNTSITSDARKQRPASAQPQIENTGNDGDYGYDDDFENESAQSDTEIDVKKKSKKDDGDTTSIRTYVSVEHVSSGV